MLNTRLLRQFPACRCLNCEWWMWVPQASLLDLPMAPTPVTTSTQPLLPQAALEIQVRPESSR